MNLVDTVERWISARELNRAASTISGYRRLTRKYIQPTQIGAMEVCTLTESEMIQLLRPLILRGYTRQAQLLQVLVSAALRDAVRRREIGYNPMDGVEKVQHQPRMAAWLTVDQAAQLLASSEQRNDPLYLAWLLMLCCGLRRGEMLGLRWDDVDWQRAQLNIERQQITVDRSTIITRPKTRKSVRQIPLDDHVLTMLRLHQNGDGAILKGVTAKMLHDGLDRALAAAGVPRVTLHGLRHTMAATAAGEGVAIKILQGLMGHAHYQTTADIYAHVDLQPRRQAAAVIAARLLGTRLEIV